MIDSPITRRTALKTTGGLLSFAVLTGSAAANGTQNKNYGNGNGLGAFLNEKAEFKDSPIWTGDIADRRGQEVVDVDVGALTTVDHPEAPDQLPVAFAPQAIQVSPGATVRWTWISNQLGIPIPHDVVSLVDENGEPVVEPGGDRLFQSQILTYNDGDPTFEYTFDDKGTYLYYCTPHGAPFTVETPHGEEVYNEFGMRGAVKVTGNPV